MSVICRINLQAYIMFLICLLGPRWGFTMFRWAMIPTGHFLFIYGELHMVDMSQKICISLSLKGYSWNINNKHVLSLTTYSNICIMHTSDLKRFPTLHFLLISIDSVSGIDIYNLLLDCTFSLSFQAAGFSVNQHYTNFCVLRYLI